MSSTTVITSEPKQLPSDSEHPSMNKENGLAAEETQQYDSQPPSPRDVHGVKWVLVGTSSVGEQLAEMESNG